jgi:lysophospholipase L1-like esterase
MMTAEPITAAEWQAVQDMRVVFGHQSVGANILNGVRTLAESAGVKLGLSEARDLSGKSGFMHFAVGENGDPASKLRDFAHVLESARSGDINVAMMKLCYIDFMQDTDGKRLAERYSATLDRLASQFPKTRFVAFTAPLTTRQTGPKAWAKQLLGRTPAGYEDNARRQQFNNHLRQRYSRDGQLFDVAGIESEGVETYQYQGHPLETLNPALTNDGGHLNAEGQQRVAARLIKFLAALPRS